MSKNTQNWQSENQSISTKQSWLQIVLMKLSGLFKVVQPSSNTQNNKPSEVAAPERVQTHLNDFGIVHSDRWQNYDPDRDASRWERTSYLHSQHFSDRVDPALHYIIFYFWY